MKNEKIVKSYDKILPEDKVEKEILDCILEENRSKFWRGKRAGVGKEMFMKKTIAMILLGICLVTVSGSVYAAYRWLTAKQAAETIGDKKLAKYFGTIKDDIQVQETKNYRVAFLGTVNGKNISGQILDEKNDKTYAAVAVERKDGKPMKESPSDIVISPFIQGVHPEDFNIYEMGGGATYKIIDGIYYAIAECDDLQIFAKQGVYLGVMDGPCMKTGYVFDQKTGEIKRNKNYKGLNALFDLKLDRSKADEKAAKEYLNRIENKKDIEESVNESTNKNVDWNHPQDILKHSKFFKDSEKELTSDKDGMLNYSYKNKFEVTVMKDQIKENVSDLNIISGEKEGQEYVVEIYYKNGKYIGRTYEFFGNQKK